MQLADRRNSWDMQSDGTYIQRSINDGEDLLSIHEKFIELAERRSKAVARRKRKKFRSKMLHNLRIENQLYDK